MENIGFIETVGNIAISATFNGAKRSAAVGGVAATDVQYRLRFQYFNAHFCLNQVGTCKIQGSNDDGATWVDATAGTANVASVGLTLQVPCTFKSYRAVFVNGATGTTVQSITTSFLV